MRPIQVNQIVTMTGGTLLQGDDSLAVTSVEHNSREVKEGALFVPIIGEHADGHSYISSAVAQGAVCTFTSRRDIKMQEGCAYIYVEDTLQALQRLAGAYRSLFDIPVIGITGSVGKTTTKEMIASVLEKKYQVLRTFGNWNSQIGVAMMMFHIDDTTEIAVIEMGISMPGEMERLVSIARPGIAVMTNIGVSHIGNLGSRENICREKGKIVGSFEDGTLYICGNGDLKQLSLKCIERERAKGSCQFVYYGTETDCEAFADNICTEDDETFFTYHFGAVQEQIKLSMLGIHQVNNAVISYLIGSRFGVPVRQIKEALYEYHSMDMRGSKKEGNQISILDDTYNASPDSVASGLNVLYDSTAKGRKIAILADVFELGDRTEMEHVRIGTGILEDEKEGRRLDLLVTVGKAAEWIAKTVSEGSNQIQVKSFHSKEEAIPWLLQHRMAGDLYLVKGSRGMKMDDIVRDMLA